MRYFIVLEPIDNKFQARRDVVTQSPLLIKSCYDTEDSFPRG